MHNVAGYVTCCQTKLSRYPTLIMHMARHLQPEDFKLVYCYCYSYFYYILLFVFSFKIFVYNF